MRANKETWRMAVNVTRISDLETRNRDHQFTGVVANRAATSDRFPQNVRRKPANFKSPNSPQSPVLLPARPHSGRMSWPSPFLFSTLRNGTRCAFRSVDGDDPDINFIGREETSK